MKTNTIITISREFGSRGHEIGKKLAEKLGVPFYDNEIITMSAKESGYAEEMFAGADQTPVTSLLFSLSMFGANVSTGELPLNDKVFIAQSDIIRKIAEKGSCVIVGRCADYVLRENANLIKIFIYADINDKVKWAINEKGVSADKAKDLVTKTDKRRAAYYNYYTNGKWGSAKSYNLCLNSTGLTDDAAVSVLSAYVENIN